MSKLIVIPTNPADLKALKDAAQEYSDSMTRIESEREQCRSIVETMEEKFEVPRKYLNRMFRQYHKNEYDKEFQENADYSELYEKVFQ